MVLLLGWKAEGTKQLCAYRLKGIENISGRAEDGRPHPLDNQESQEARARNRLPSERAKETSKSLRGNISEGFLLYYQNPFTLLANSLYFPRLLYSI